MDPNGEEAVVSSSYSSTKLTRKLPAWASSSDQQAELKGKAHKRGPEIDADGDEEDGQNADEQKRVVPLTKTTRKSPVGDDTGETKRGTSNNKIGSSQAAKKNSEVGGGARSGPRHHCAKEMEKEETVNNAVRNAQPGSKPAAPLQDFSKLLEGVVFAISGMVNPARSNLREQAIEMGARYKPDWTSDCTLLVCAFPNTPKFKQVTADGGTIVSKDWIPECHRQRKLIDIDRYLLNEGRPWRHSSLAQVAQTVNIDDKKSGKETSCGSYGDIQQLVYQDLMSSISWLQQQEEKPTPEDLEAIAAQGILICLEDTIKGLQETSGVTKIVKDWGFVPHAVKKLAALEECGGSGKYNVVKEAERLHGIYAEELKKLSARSRASKRADEKKESEKEEQEAVKDDDVDDDATEVMSDEDSGEAVEQDDRRP
ncbi:unnamed protein product [Sphagnum troendelagicum]|uniref:BRCT domain-containing protein n=1 Tax=Sphagnum troendelagicum TaxID=128251 RepID=A0ABP0TKS2_9BRYO